MLPEQRPVSNVSSFRDGDGWRIKSALVYWCLTAGVGLVPAAVLSILLGPTLSAADRNLILAWGALALPLILARSSTAHVNTIPATPDAAGRGRLERAVSFWAFFGLASLCWLWSLTTLHSSQWLLSLLGAGASLLVAFRMATHGATRDEVQIQLGDACARRTKALAVAEMAGNTPSSDSGKWPARQALLASPIPWVGLLLIAPLASWAVVTGAPSGRWMVIGVMLIVLGSASWLAGWNAMITASVVSRIRLAPARLLKLNTLVFECLALAQFALAIAFTDESRTFVALIIWLAGTSSFALFVYARTDNARLKVFRRAFALRAVSQAERDIASQQRRLVSLTPHEDQARR